MEGMRERGVAALEAAAWLTALLPCAVLGATVCMKAHDQRVLGVIPEAAIREAAVPALRWSSDGNTGSFAIDPLTVRSMAESLALSARREAEASVLRMSQISVRACGWVYRVDTQTGALGALERQECAALGSLPLAAELLGARQSALEGRPGIRLGSPGEAPIFADRVLVVGVAVGGGFPSLGGALGDGAITAASAGFPRSEVSL